MITSPDNSKKAQHASPEKKAPYIGLALSLAGAFFPTGTMNAQEPVTPASPPVATAPVNPSINAVPFASTAPRPVSEPQADPVFADAIRPVGSPIDWVVSGVVSGVVRKSIAVAMGKIFGSAPAKEVLKESLKPQEFNLIDQESKSLMKELNGLRTLQATALSFGRNLPDTTIKYMKGIEMTLRQREAVALQKVHVNQQTQPKEPTRSTPREPMERPEPKEKDSSTNSQVEKKAPEPKPMNEQPEPEGLPKEIDPVPNTESPPPPRLIMPRPDGDGPQNEGGGGRPPNPKIAPSQARRGLPRGAAHGSGGFGLSPSIRSGIPVGGGLGVDEPSDALKPGPKKSIPSPTDHIKMAREFMKKLPEQTNGK